MKIIFKHSYKCPISRAAKQEMDAFLQETPNAAEYEFVDVIDNRSRSNEIEREYGVVHESPQIIILDGNNGVIWSASHRAITQKAISEALKGGKTGN